MKTNKTLQIGVVGYAANDEYTKGGGPTTNNLKLAEEVGSLLAKQDAIVITGGKGGIMEYAAKGAKKNGGTTIGVVKGKQRFTSNSYTDIEVISGMEADGMDELTLVLMSDALIVIGGGAGTLQEIAIAYRNNKPIVVLKDTGGWADKVANTYLDERNRVKIEVADTPEDAVEKILKLVTNV